MERLIVYGALGYYVYQHMKLKKDGKLPEEDSWVLKLDKEKVLKVVKNQFGLNEFQTEMLSGFFDNLTNGVKNE